MTKTVCLECGKLADMTYCFDCRAKHRDAAVQKLQQALALISEAWLLLDDGTNDSIPRDVKKMEETAKSTITRLHGKVK